MNWTSDFYDVYQAPFDEMNPLNIAREVGYQRSFKQQSLKMYKRAATAEMTLLNDPNFGPETMDRMIETIDRAAELTMMVVIGNACVELPFYERVERYNHVINGFNHSREMMNQEATTFAGADSNADVITLIIQDLPAEMRANTVIMPAGMPRGLIRNAGQPQPVDGWKPYYDTKIKKMLMGRYDAAATSIASIPYGNGALLNCFEMVKQKGYMTDPDETAYNPLNSTLVLGEVIVPGAISLDDLDSPEACTSSKQCDVMAPEHTPLHLSIVKLAFREYLKSNFLFLDQDGECMSHPDDGLSYRLDDLASMYTEAGIKDFEEAFHTKAHFDNNSAARVYRDRAANLKEMTGFRHYFGFLSYDNAATRIIVPERVGDVEPKTLPPRYVWQAAKVIASRLSITYSEAAVAPRDADPVAAYNEKLKRLLPNSNAHGNLDDLAKADGIQLPIETGKEKPPTWPMGAAAGADGPVSFVISPDSHLAPRTGESKAQYLARQRNEHVEADLESGELHGEETAWLHLLQHVPDEGLDAFYSLVYLTHQDGRAASATDNEHLAALTKKLAERSQQGHVTETLKAVVRAVEEQAPDFSGGEPQSVGDILAEQGDRNWFTNTTLKQLNAKGKQHASLARTVADHLEGLEADASHLGGPARGLSDVRRFGTGRPREIFSWQAYSQWLNDNRDEDVKVRKAYVALLQARFNFYTCDKLASLGIMLFRQNYVRMQIEMSADSMVVLRSGPDTWFLALGHGQVLNGISAPDGAYSMTAQFHMGVIERAGARYMRLIPHVLPRELFGGRNVRPVKTQADLLQAEPQDRASLMVIPTPITESALEWPMTMDRGEPYRAPNTQVGTLYNRKTSMTDAVAMFFGVDQWNMNLVDNNALSQHFMHTTVMATQLQRSCAYYNMTNDINDRTWKLVDGTGCIGAGTRNTPECAKAYMGLGPFAGQAIQTVLG